MIRALLALAAAALLGSPAPPSSPAPAPSHALVTTRALANGLRVVVVEDHAAPVAQVATYYRFGSDDERRGATGLAHGLEHMMFRGTSAISGGGYDVIAARLGAQINADTNEDYTHYYWTLPADRAALALRLEADRMRGLTLSAADWSLEKGAVLGEYDGDLSQPLFRLTMATRARAWSGTPFARTALGIRSDVARSTVGELRAYYDAWYRPDDATVVVTGDVDPERILAEAERDFGAIPARPLPRPTDTATASAAPLSAAPPVVRQSADYPYTVVDLAYRLPGDLDPGAAATQVFTQLINSERSTFYDALVRSGLTLGYSASASSALHAGIAHVLLFVTPGRSADAARRAFETTLAAVRAHGVDPGLLADAKTAQMRAKIYARDAISGLGDRYGYAYGVEGRDPSVDDAAVAALDASAENAAIGSWFALPAAVGILTPNAPVPGAPPPGGAAGGGVVDNFSSRAPSGAVRIAPWARAALARPVAIRSRVDPVRFTLPNGLRLAVQPVRTNPTVFISGVVRLDPEADPPGKTGVAALTSTLLGYGSARYDFTALRAIPDRLGAEVQYGAGFGAHGLARDLPTLLDLLAQTVRRPTFPQRYVDQVLAQERGSVAQRRANPDYLAERAFETALYAPGDPVLREESVASLARIRRADLVRFAARALRPERTTLVVTGDVDPAAVRDAVAAAFGNWRGQGAAPPHRVLPLPPPHAVVRIVPVRRPTVAVRLGQPALGRDDPDFVPFNLLNAVLGAGGSFDTRLMHEIRERRGLVYGVSSSLLATRERGIFEIDLTAAAPKARAAVGIAERQLRLVRQSGVSADELAQARTKLVASTLVGEEATATIGEHVANIVENRLRPTYYRDLSAIYGRVSLADVARVARRRLAPDRLVEVDEGPPPASRR